MEWFKKYQGQIIGIGVVIVVIVVGFVLTGQKSSDSMVEDTDETNNVASTIPFSANAFEAVMAGPYEYTLKGIEWLFSEEAGRAHIRLQIVGLTRSGVAIEVLPYRLGSYPGACSEMDMPAGLILPASSRSLAYAQCEDIESSRQFVVTQEGKNIVTRTRVLTQDTETPFEQIQSIDVTTIVR